MGEFSKFKEEFNKLMKLKGKVRGVVFQTDAEYVRNRGGEEGLSRLEEELKKIGYPIEYKDIKATSWYSLGMRVISLLVIKEIFNLNDKEIEEMGNAAPKYSFILRMLMKFFVTIQMSYKESPKYWEKHYTIGELEAPGYDLKKRYFIVRLKDFKIDPVLCIYFGGYFKRISQFLLKDAKNFKIEETKCMFKGDPYHEFLITWE